MRTDIRGTDLGDKRSGSVCRGPGLKALDKLCRVVSDLWGADRRGGEISMGLRRQARGPGEMPQGCEGTNCLAALAKGQREEEAFWQLSA